MKRIGLILSLMAGALASTAVAAVQIPLTTTTYDVFYHWGIINKLAGHGYATYQSSGNSFYGQMEGHSIPWSGRIYTVQTSLSCNFTPDGGEASEETVNSMQGKYTKPFVGRNPQRTPYKTIYGAGTLDASEQTMEAVTIMSDMLSIFYYAHEIDFRAMQPGHRLTIPIVRDGNRQTLYITYNGTALFSYNGYSTRAYEIVFQYTFNGAPDKYPVKCLIDCNTLAPVEFSANLLIGKVEMKYVP